MIVLNLTIETIVGLISIVFMIVSVGFITKVLNNYRNLFMILFWLTWVFLTVYYIFIIFSILFLNKLLFIIASYILIIAYILIIIAFDLMKEDRIRAVRFSLFILLIGFYLSLLVKGDFVGYYYYDNGEISLTIIGFNRYVLAVIAIYTIFTFVSNTINIYNKSTDNLKKYARINLIGTLLFSVVPLFLYIFEIYQYLPGMDILFPAIGLLIVSIAIYKSPQILYLLSFELYHISVIQGNTGLILYHYSWETEFHMNYMKQQMYSSMLSALASFSDNTMNAGRFTSLSLEKGVLIIRYRPEFNYYFALFVNKETKMMMNSLSKFEDQFIMRYGFQLMNNENYIISLTEEDDLIHEIFNFINNKKT